MIQAVCATTLLPMTLIMKSVALSRVMSILSRRNLRKQLNVIQEALPCHQQQWLMQIEQWPISKLEGKFCTEHYFFPFRHQVNVLFL